MSATYANMTGSLWELHWLKTCNILKPLGRLSKKKTFVYAVVEQYLLRDIRSSYCPKCIHWKVVSWNEWLTARTDLNRTTGTMTAKTAIGREETQTILHYILIQNATLINVCFLPLRYLLSQIENASPKIYSFVRSSCKKKKKPKTL